MSLFNEEFVSNPFNAEASSSRFVSPWDRMSELKAQLIVDEEFEVDMEEEEEEETRQRSTKFDSLLSPSPRSHRPSIVLVSVPIPFQRIY